MQNYENSTEISDDRNVNPIKLKSNTNFVLVEFEQRYNVATYILLHLFPFANYVFQ